tara:strand:- start:125 stop:1366 length:1242 start_codon:yes stop_codon:yes gene_type:complete
MEYRPAPPDPLGLDRAWSLYKDLPRGRRELSALGEVLTTPVRAIEEAYPTRDEVEQWIEDQPSHRLGPIGEAVISGGDELARFLGEMVPSKGSEVEEELLMSLIPMGKFDGFGDDLSKYLSSDDFKDLWFNKLQGSTRKPEGGEVIDEVLDEAQSSGAGFKLVEGPEPPEMTFEDLTPLQQKVYNQLTDKQKTEVSPSDFNAMFPEEQNIFKNFDDMSVAEKEQYAKYKQKRKAEEQTAEEEYEKELEEELAKEAEYNLLQKEKLLSTDLPLTSLDDIIKEFPDDQSSYDYSKVYSKDFWEDYDYGKINAELDKEFDDLANTVWPMPSGLSQQPLKSNYEDYTFTDDQSYLWSMLPNRLKDSIMVAEDYLDFFPDDIIVDELDPMDYANRLKAAFPELSNGAVLLIVRQGLGL